MSWKISKKPNNNNNQQLPEEEDDQEENPNFISISSHLYLKQVDSSGGMDKKVVLRRIRHRKRVNKIRFVLGFLFPTTSSGNATADDTNNNAINPVDKTGKWVDDAFAAP